jgi:16S rRNA (guanine527-N7)-methyltransferase
MGHDLEQKLEEFGKCLLKWNEKIALTSRSSDNFWKSHRGYIDEAYFLSGCLNPNQSVIDIGSGNGYPAIPLALLGHTVTMVDSNHKKGSFLKYVVSKLGLNATVITEDVQHLKSPVVQLVTKAFASVTRTLTLTHNLYQPETVYFMLKGEKLLDEIKEAESHFTFSFKIHPFQGNNKGVLELWNVRDVR